MEFRVRFRFNKNTGQVEVFEVHDEGTVRLDARHHDPHHDRIATEIGNILDRRATISEFTDTVDVDTQCQRIKEQSAPEQQDTETDSPDVQPGETLSE